LSPWWSRPTADDLPDDLPEDDETFDEEEAGDDAGEKPKSRSRRAAAGSDEPDETEEGGSTRRRRPRRRRGERQSTDSSSEPEKRESQASKGKAKGKSSAARQSKKKDDRDAKGKSSAESGRGRSSDNEEETPEREGRRRRPRRRTSAASEADEPGAAQKAPQKVAEAPAVEKVEKEVVRKVVRAGDGQKGAEDSEETFELSFDVSPEGISREIVVSLPEERSQSVNHERKIALFCDLENVALGVRDSGDVNKFDIHLVLERLLEKGKIIVKKAYCDWERYNEYKRAFHEAAIELIDIPQKYYSGKNSADIKMVVDAMDLSYSKEHLDTFVLLSGDSDFSPLVSKLKENNKYVIGVGVKNSSSNLLIDNCDEFLYYEDIWRDTQKVPQLDGLSKKKAEAFSLMVDAIQALVRENKDVLWGSMIKQTMQRKKPSFNEGYYGYGSFSELLEDAAKHEIVKLKKDQRSGSYIVTGFPSQKKKR
jgi:uncharacterized protein (TIGR00288 family)